MAPKLWELGQEGFLLGTFPRLTLTGTKHDGSEWSLSSGWGSTASVNASRSNDSIGEIIVVPGGAGIADFPIVTLTFKDGPWSEAPNVIYERHSPPQVGYWQLATLTASQIGWAWAGTPVAPNNHVLNYFIVGFRIT